MNIIDKIKARKEQQRQDSLPKTHAEIAQHVADLVKPPPPLTHNQQCDFIEKTLGAQRKDELAAYLVDKGLTSSQLANMSAKTVLEHNSDYDSDKHKAKLAEGNPLNQISKLLGDGDG